MKPRLKRTELTVRVAKDQHKRLRAAVYRLNISQCSALVQALEMWLEQVEREVVEDRAHEKVAAA